MVKEEPTLAQCYYCDKEKLVTYFNLLSKWVSYCWGWNWRIVEKFQIVRDRMWKEDLMCSLLPSKIREYKINKGIK